MNRFGRRARRPPRGCSPACRGDGMCYNPFAMLRNTILRPIVIVLLAGTCAWAQTRVLHREKSAFNEIIVEEDASGIRTLLFEENGAMQTAMKVSAPTELVLSYARAIMVPLAIVPEPRRMLIVGLGGGAMPKYLHKAYPEARIDVAELDPAVIEVAKKFFFFREDERLKAHAGDGRKFIETTDNRYDVIFLDAYGADSIPYSLATREFLLAVKAKLADGGICVGNVWSYRSNRQYWSMLKTYQDVFPELHIVRASASENHIFIALPVRKNLTRELLIEKAGELRKKRMPDLPLPDLVRDGYLPIPSLPAEAKVLLDRDAPRQ